MSEKQGCSTLVAVLVAAAAFVVGGVGGAGAMYFLADQTAPTPQPVQPVTVVAEAKPAVTTPDYGLLYPIEETLRIQGKLPPESVTGMVKDKRYSLRECYQKGLDKDPTLKGEMSVQFTVSGDTGRVIAAIERNTDVGNAMVRDCIINNIKGWQLASTKAGDSVVRFDMLLLPLASAPTE